jgi:hypothetical protein
MKMTCSNQYGRSGTVAAVVGCALLLAVVAGCVPDESSAAGAGGISTTLGEFIVSFARSAAAAWLL